jgi:hypothetical protein
MRKYRLKEAHQVRFESSTWPNTIRYVQQTPRTVCAELLGYGQEELELRRELLLGVETVAEVQAADATICVDLHPKGFDVVRAVRPSGKVGEVKLNLVPPLVETHRHRTDKWLDTSRGLVVAGTKSSANALVVENLHFEGEILLKILDDHDEKGQLDAEGLVGIRRAGNEAGVDVAADQLQYTGLDILIGDAFDVAVTHLLVPNLQRAAADTVQNRKKAGLKGILEHLTQTASIQ